MNHMNYKEMNSKVRDIVNRNLEKYIGGETYFDYLDEDIKNDKDLICSYISYIYERENINNVIVSGKIGCKIKQYQNEKMLPDSLKILFISGGLRKDNQVENLTNSQIENKRFIFLDDSYYSGKTTEKVIQAIKSHGGEVIRVYVIYDGSKENTHNVISLYRYYERKEAI